MAGRRRRRSFAVPFSQQVHFRWREERYDQGKRVCRSMSTSPTTLTPRSDVAAAVADCSLSLQKNSRNIMEINNEKRIKSNKDLIYKYYLQELINIIIINLLTCNFNLILIGKFLKMSDE